MSSLPGHGFDADALSELEQSIRAASGYIVASDNLRPRVLEAARDQAQVNRGWWRMLQIMVVLFVCSVVSVPATRRFELWREQNSAPTSDQLQQRAIKLAQKPQVGQSWALYEAFHQLKESTAVKLRQQ